MTTEQKLKIISYWTIYFKIQKRSADDQLYAAYQRSIIASIFTSFHNDYDDVVNEAYRDIRHFAFCCLSDITDATSWTL